ncbi:hypothetical protein [Paenarthrobacter ureafaciens]|jgi:hypothetical protein|uniref:hypothetical protein n=1 Tax=Paenarthrobacter ureafaciens TaxID=37931 RepID=UPI001FB31888|nr:hypothetical protein [Paenarthrobacter ureafaciens]UOD82896.1 hypothetical protein MQZ73_08675 [Paenarthrobacter ureafaciens]WNZ02603.1 hypothetical protein PVT25_13235 [Paenarthrobacter ureafaciens]
MTEHVETNTPALAEELLGVVQAVDGVTAVFPAQPLWQSIAGAAAAAVTGEQQPLVGLSGQGEGIGVKVRIGVGIHRPAPEVARDVAAAVRKHLRNASTVVEVLVVKIGQ